MAARVSPGTLANRLEYIVTAEAGDTLRVAVSGGEGRVRLSAGLTRALRAGTARAALHLAGGRAPQCLLPLATAPRLESGPPSVLALPLSGAEVAQFLDRQLLREFRVNAQGRPLTGLVGPASVAALGGNQYRLAVTLGQVLQFASPDSCQLMMFDRDAAYRVSVATGLMGDPAAPGVPVAPATALAPLGAPPAILLATPAQFQLGDIPLRTPQEIRVSLANWGAGPADVPLRFVSNGLAALNVPSLIRLDAGRPQELTIQVQALRGGLLSGTLWTGGASLALSARGPGEGGPGPRGPHGGGDPVRPGPEPPEVDLHLAATAMDPTTMRLTWNSPGEGVTYVLVCRSTSSPELPEWTFDFRGRASRPAGQKEWAEFRHLPADGSYRFTLRATGNGIAKTDTEAQRLAP